MLGARCGGARSAHSPRDLMESAMAAMVGGAGAALASASPTRHDSRPGSSHLLINATIYYKCFSRNERLFGTGKVLAWKTHKCN